MSKRRVGLAWLPIVSAAAVLAGHVPAALERNPGSPVPAATRARQTSPSQPEAPGKAALELTSAWTVRLPAPPAGPPAWDAASAFVPLASGEVASLALETGSVRWRVQSTPSAIAAGGGLVYLAMPGALDAREAATGALRWRFAPGAELGAALEWNGGWLLAGTSGGEAIMLRASDGLVLWRQNLGAALEPGAAMTGDRLYLLLSNGNVEARQLGSGELIWQRRLGGKGTTLVALDDRIFAGADDNFLYCLSADDGDRRWRWRTGGTIIGTPVVDEDRIYFLALDNVLRSLDRGNGHQRWQRNLGFRPSAGPFLAGGVLIVCGVGPDVAFFQPSTGAPAGEMALAGHPAAPPRVLPGRQQGEAALVVLTRDAQLQRLATAGPPLESKPLPGLPKFLPVERSDEDHTGNR